MATIPRSSTSGTFLLRLDGGATGVVKSVDGGGVYADVVAEPLGPEGFTKKHVGPPRYEEFAVQIDLSAPADVFEWINATWNRKAERKNGAVVGADVSLNAVSERQFTDALLTEVTIPALDGSSKDAGFLTVRFAPESTRTVKGSGKATADKAKQKKWLCSNFRLRLGDLDTSKVARIDGFTVRQRIAQADVGDRRERTREPAGVEFPNLRVTLAAASAQTWTTWFDEFVVKGNNGDENELSGEIAFLSANRLEELGRIELANVGIFGLRQQQSTGDQVARVVVDLYCERMELKVGGA